jgi:hypothetical protein
VSTPEPNRSTAEYARTLAMDSYAWYGSHAIRARRVFKSVEVAVVALSVSIPAVIAIWPDALIAAALLGAAVALLTGLRSIFHWQDNYLRFSEAREAVNRELRLYEIGAPPYDDARVADTNLVEAVSAIEQSEMGGWLRIAATRPST